MRKKLSVLALVMMVALTGCSTSVPDLSNVDNDIAAQYLADSLLQKDKNYEDSIEYDHSVLNPTPTPEPTAAPVEATLAPSGSSTGTNGDSASSNTGASTSGQSGVSTNETSDNNASEQLTSVSLSDIYGVPGIEMKGTSYSVKSSYGTDYAVCTPTKQGNKLVVVHFTISNTTGADQKVNLKKQNIQPNLIVNGEDAGKPLMTPLEGDLQYFNTTIKADKKKQGVLLFEIDKSVKVSDIKVQFTKGNNESTVSVH